MEQHQPPTSSKLKKEDSEGTLAVYLVVFTGLYPQVFLPPMLTKSDNVSVSSKSSSTNLLPPFFLPPLPSLESAKIGKGSGINQPTSQLRKKQKRELLVKKMGYNLQVSLSGSSPLAYSPTRLPRLPTRLSLILLLLPSHSHNRHNAHNHLRRAATRRKTC